MNKFNLVICRGQRADRRPYGEFFSCIHRCIKQELSYRQQNPRQLRTQYAEGIYSLKYYTVTLKYRLRVTQGHRKRKHWIDRSYTT